MISIPVKLTKWWRKRTNPGRRTAPCPNPMATTDQILENYLSADELIPMFVRIVAKGGNLNLMVNPNGPGHVPSNTQDLLKELGDWLKVNGEAIPGTIPYETLCDNTQLGQPVGIP